MIKKVSKTEALISKLRSEGKVIRLNQQEQISRVNKMNKELENVRRDYQIKEKDSKMNALNIILTN